MNTPNYVNNILGTLKEAGHAAYVVGGCVRDHFLGKQPQDYDIATSAPPEYVLRLFPKTAPTGLKHGTVTVLSSEGACEVTTFRIDGPYEDKRRPGYVYYAQNIVEDLARRDFTMNAIAFDGKEYVDPFHGREDIKQRIIRAVGDPVERLQEDALRMLRAVRFAAQLNFTIEAQTKRSIKKYAPLLKDIAAERVRDELCKLLLSPHPGNGLKLMHELGLVVIVLPELNELRHSTQQDTAYQVALAQCLSILERTPAQLVVRLAVLLSIGGKEAQIQENNEGLIPKKVLRRLRFDRKTIERVNTLIKESQNSYLNESLLEVKKFINRIGSENLEAFFALQIARSKAGQDTPTLENILQLRETINIILQEKQPLTLQDLAITGQDLIDLGLKEGPEIGRILHTLWEKVLAEASLNQKDILLSLAKTEIKSSLK